jgi:PAS domain S-box-containing protein
MGEEIERLQTASRPGLISRKLRALSLRTRFFLGIGIILLCFCSICAYIIYRQGKLLIEEAAHAKSQIVMAAVEATQNYVRQVLRPKIFEVLGKDGFIMEAMSTSYVSRAVMDRFNAAMPEYRYRRVSIHARNPKSEANATEVRMLQYFAANPDKQDWEGIVPIEGESQYMRYRPVYFSASCLHCHGAVADAPKALLEQYGNTRGFGHQVGDLAGVTAVGIPVDIALAQLKGKAWAVFMSCLFGAGVLFVVLISFFNRLVAGDLRKVLNIFRQELPEEAKSGDVALPGKPDVGLGEVPPSLRWADELKMFEAVQGQDEIEEITRAAQAMALRLRDKQARLLQSKELLQSVFDSITDMVILMDKDFRIKMVNKAFLQRYSQEETEVLGKQCSTGRAGELCLGSNCGLPKVLQLKAPVVEEVQTPAGEIFLLHFYPVLDERGDVASIVRYARDITEPRRLEQNIQQTEKLASLGQLAAGIAHEINNPLGVILTYTDLLKHQVANAAEALEDVNTIEKHTISCKRIVADLLKFAHSEKALKKLTSLNGVIQEAVDLVMHQLSRQQIAVHLELSPDLPLLNLDADKMQQVFFNLLMNAQQAIGAGGEIRITTSWEEETGCEQVVVWDNGAGIPLHLLTKIFDPFFSTKAPGEGTGLGLSVSYGIVKDHGGDIQVKSEPGQGTQFTILLPGSAP